MIKSLTLYLLTVPLLFVASTAFLVWFFNMDDDKRWILLVIAIALYAFASYGTYVAFDIASKIDELADVRRKLLFKTNDLAIKDRSRVDELSISVSSHRAQLNLIQRILSNKN